MTHRFVPPEGAPIVEIPADTPTCAVPQYQAVDGTVRKVSGRLAEAWPHPRELYGHDGSLFVEVVLGDPWWVSSDAVIPRWPRTPIGTFLQQYRAGRRSGFPLAAVLVYSLRASWDHARRAPVPSP